MKKIIFAACVTSILSAEWLYLKLSTDYSLQEAENQVLQEKASLAKATLEKQRHRESTRVKRRHSSEFFPDGDNGPRLVEAENIGTTEHAEVSKSIKNVATTKKMASSKRTKSSPVKNKAVIAYAKRFLGLRYKYGGENIKKAIDCSAFTKHVMRKKCNINLPRTAAMQASSGKHVDKKDLRAGDLVFFKETSRHAYISHVGIMISKTKFIHASSGAKKVTITRLYKPYYIKHYFGARRL